MNKAITRFKMVKARHEKTFSKARQEKKADKKMISLCKFINSRKEFFTSSSCSGRILLLGLMEGESKRDSFFHKKWHKTAKFSEILNALKEKTKGSIWLKQEAFIIHIGTNSLKNAKKILKIMRQTGIKRGGIIVAVEGKFLLEVIGTQSMNVLVKEKDKVLIEENYLKKLVEAADKKLEKNYKKLKEFEKALRKEIR